MIIDKQTQVTKDVTNKRLIIVRDFDAPVEQTWKAWTEKELLDQWWAPRPWKAQTKSLDFREGGFWLYQMVGPDGGGSWCREDYKTIKLHKSFAFFNLFCNEKGEPDTTFPMMEWKVDFSEKNGTTKVRVEIKFDTKADMNKILEMGLEEGFTMAMGNLDELLAK